MSLSHLGERSRDEVPGEARVYSNRVSCGPYRRRVSTNHGIAFAIHSISLAYLCRIEPLVLLLVPSTLKPDHSRIVVVGTMPSDDLMRLLEAVVCPWGVRTTFNGHKLATSASGVHQHIVSFLQKTDPVILDIGCYEGDHSLRFLELCPFEGTTQHPRAVEGVLLRNTSL